jgi:acetylornithine aminotransferase
LRILPPLSITKEDVDHFFAGLKKALETVAIEAPI